MNDHFVAQEGGDHYQSEYQHWDWVIDCKLNYLEGNASKYVVRWRKKNGIQDLHKALTYVHKMQARMDNLPVATRYTDISVLTMRTASFVEINNLGELEAEFCFLMARWQHHHELQRAEEIIVALAGEAVEIMNAQEAAGLAAGGPCAGGAATVAPGA